MIDVGKNVRVLRGKRKGEEGIVIRHQDSSKKIGNQWIRSEAWFVMFPDGDVRMYDEKALEEAEDQPSD